MILRLLTLALSLGLLNALSPLSSRPGHVGNTIKVTSRNAGYESSYLFQTPHRLSKMDMSNENKKASIIRKVLDRFDTLESAGIKDAKVAGLGKRIKSLHNPVTYMALALAAGLKWQWCFRNPYYWFGVAFCVKWYRARYVFKIPVWDRQPNWNNIITSKEQEKDLKAFTCLNCGSTLFIAKTREFFFEGDTGIGGLGCFTCGVKGKENFVMDRDRIVEDVADVDDYFEYERPLDFVSRAERRELLKEAGGDEEKANQLLVERASEDAPGAPGGDGAQKEEASVNGDAPADASAATESEDTSAAGEEEAIVEAEIVEVDSTDDGDEAPVEVTGGVETPTEDTTPVAKIEPEKKEVETEISKEATPVEASAKKPKSEKKKKVSKKVEESRPTVEASSDDLDLLGMDDF